MYVQLISINGICSETPLAEENIGKYNLEQKFPQTRHLTWLLEVFAVPE